MDTGKKVSRTPKTFCITFIYFLTAILLLATAPAAHALWQDNPEISLAAADNDPRIPTVIMAVQFWNTILRELDISLQFGSIHLMAPPDIEESLKSMSAKDLASEERIPFPSFMDNIDTEILIVLTDAEFVSFAEYWEKEDKALVAVKSALTPPLSLPNVTRNVIAHELGHVLGLDHNSLETMLMCGRPFSCRPDRFSSPSPRFYQLTDSEKALLYNMYENNFPGEGQVR